MPAWLRWLVLVVLLQGLSKARTAKILGVVPIPSRSHNTLVTSLLKELATRGHQVTAISGMPLDKPLANYTHIEISSNVIDLVGTTNLFDFYNGSCLDMFLMVLHMGKFIAKSTYEDKRVKELLQSNDSHFDLVIVEDFGNEALAGMAHVFNAPLIYFSAATGLTWTNDFIGNPNNPAYQPDVFLPFTDHMTFVERVHNTIVNIVLQLYYHLFHIPTQDAVMRQHLQGIKNLPHLSEINAKTSLVLINAIPGVNYPKPLLPNLIPVGGMHLKTPKPLTQDLQKFLNDAPEGVIYFSMGSVIQSAQFPVRLRESFLKSFSKLKQKVLWKFEAEHLPGQPSNVLIRKWLPQNDILAHPNVKVFITHGGILGSQEGISHGLPMIGIPIFGDQRLNLGNAQRLGYAIVLDFYNITETSVSWALNEALNNPRYSERAKAVSRIFHDQPHTPMERAVYWTEYVLRHKGAPHLRSAAMDLTWYQYLLLDVIAAMLLFVLTVVSVVLLTCRKLFCSRKYKTVSSDKKNK